MSFQLMWVSTTPIPIMCTCEFCLKSPVQHRFSIIKSESLPSGLCHIAVRDRKEHSPEAYEIQKEK